jgi:two-component system sensor kinase FixL
MVIGTRQRKGSSKTPAKRLSGKIRPSAAEALRQARQALRESEKRFQRDQAHLMAIVNTAVDAIVTIDEIGRIDSVNPATEKLFGYSAAELVGQNVKMLMPDPYQREHDGYLRNYLRSGRAPSNGRGRGVTGRRQNRSPLPI